MVFAESAVHPGSSCILSPRLSLSGRNRGAFSLEESDVSHHKDNREGDVGRVSQSQASLLNLTRLLKGFSVSVYIRQKLIASCRSDVFSDRKKIRQISVSRLGIFP